MIHRVVAAVVGGLTAGAGLWVFFFEAEGLERFAYGLWALVVVALSVRVLTDRTL